MNPRIRYSLWIAGGCILAVWTGWDVAQGSYALPAMFALIAISAVLVRVGDASLDAIVLGGVLIGYLVGNRGFAQLMPIPGLPLFPAEIALSMTVGCLVVRCAFARRLPWQGDALNWAVLAWVLIGTARVPFDLRHYGLLAIRDFAMIYYAGFFFVAQAFSVEQRSQRFLHKCLIAGGILLPLVYAAYQSFSAFFLRTLTLHGVPLVYFKDDLLETSMAACAVTIFFFARGRHRFWAWPLSIFVFLQVIASDSRASMMGALVALCWLIASRRPIFPVIQLGIAAVAFSGVLFLANVVENPWARDKLDGLNDRMASLVDPAGLRQYRSNESFDKGDDNRFRMVWWRTVTEETLSQDPVLGLGFGYDLAKGFLHVYEPEVGDDFVTRSPHSIVVSTFGRMGVIGLAAFVAMAGAMAFQTWRALRDSSTDPASVGLWCAAWVIITSACFGVVLEGPMGAVVFWSVLGLANGTGKTTKAAATPDAGSLNTAS